MFNIQRLANTLLFALIAAFASLLTACVSQTPIPQYADNLNFAVVYVHDDANTISSEAIADDVSADFTKVLTDRNLSVQPIAFPAVENQLKAIRDTERRIQALQATSRNSQFILITEIDTEYYSALSGRYRWDVNARISIYDLTTRTTVSDSFTVPAVLMYAHENGNDAIAAASEDIKKHIGSLVDRFLSGHLIRNHQTPSAAPPRQPAPTAQTPNIPENTEASLHGGASPIPQAIYFILIDRFFNAQPNNDLDVDLNDPNAWHGGDLRGIQEKLPYIKQLGFNQIWISPAFLTASEKFYGNAAFHAYWTYDLNQIDPHFGTEDDLKSLAQTAQQYGIGIVLDFVVNHVGYGSPLIEQKPSWFHPPLTIEDWNDPEQLVTRQVHGLPDLDQNNPEVYAYLSTAARKWLSLPNITGLRLDAVKHVSLDFWKKFNGTLEAEHPKMMLLGEYFDGDPKKTDTIQREGHFTHLFDFPLAFALRNTFCEQKNTVADLASTVANDLQYSSPNHMVTFIDNHDMPRFISLCKNDKRAMENALRVLLSWRGIPSIYYGTEIPLSGSKEPDNRSDMTFAQASFGTLIQKYLSFRQNYPVLAYGSTSVLDYRDGFAVFAREYGQSRALIAVSQVKNDTPFALPDGQWLELESNLPVKNETLIPGNSVKVFVQDNASLQLIENGRYDVSFTLPNASGSYAVVGSLPELGSWNPDHAPKGRAGQEIVLSLPAQSLIQYKLVKFNGKKTTWSNGNNHVLFINGAKHVQTSFESHR